eukprot:6521587-Pyramimonas_sp.AAC.1
MAVPPPAPHAPWARKSLEGGFSVPLLAEPRRNTCRIRHCWASFSRKQPEQIVVCFKTKPWAKP